MMSRASRPSRPLGGARQPGDVARTTRDAYRALSLSSLGLEMGIAVILGLVVGRWLDGRLGTEPWLMLLMTALGMAAGFKGVFRAMGEADRIARENEAEAAATARDAGTHRGGTP
jgi:F0F1-type ATP synthase assembly protein I